MTLSAEDLTLDQPHSTPIPNDVPPLPIDHRSSYDDEEEEEDFDDEYEEEEPHHGWLAGSTAARFLLAGGVAGAGRALSRHRQASTNIICSVADMYSAFR